MPICASPFRANAKKLTSPPAFLGTAPAPTPTLSTCWSVDLETSAREHMSLEPKVAEALAWAWRARVALRLSAGEAQRIVDTVTACAYSQAWRYPRRLLNQINWNAEMYASAATVSGLPELLVSDYGRQLGDFAAGMTRPMAGAKSPNLGAGYQFHYRPDHRDRASSNLDTPEYANIVIQALSYYDRALALGMPPLPAEEVRQLRSWMLRLLAGSWTHAGYLNWDTARGLKRWHSGQYWAFAQQGLQTIATTPRFWRDPDEGRWAKAMFDQGLMLYRRLADENHSVFAPQLMFGVETRMRRDSLFRARILAGAARAIGLGMGSLPSAQPPPLWGQEDHVRQLLGDRVTDLVTERRTLPVHHFPDGAAFRDYFKAVYGPTIAVYRNIEGDSDRIAELDAAIARVGDSVLQGRSTMEWEYLLVTARKA